jgi:2-polyprenyl-6-methoxyphenol hydroxylase-like FAD-dependent oxidoreductase
VAAVERVQTSYKVAQGTKGLVDLLSSALGMEKSEVIDQAVEAYARERRPDITRFIDGTLAPVDASPRRKRA